MSLARHDRGRGPLHAPRMHRASDARLTTRHPTGTVAKPALAPRALPLAVAVAVAVVLAVAVAIAVAVV